MHDEISNRLCISIVYICFIHSREGNRSQCRGSVFTKEIDTPRKRTDIFYEKFKRLNELKTQKKLVEKNKT